MDAVVAFIYPGGKRLQHTIPATAGNVIYNASPGTGKRWVVLRGIITLVTDATVVDRRVNLSITDGTNVIERLGFTTAAITASLTYTHCIGEVIAVSGWTLANNAYIGIQGLILEGPDQLRITVQNGVAGDSYSGYLVVLEL